MEVYIATLSGSSLKLAANRFANPDLGGTPVVEISGGRCIPLAGLQSSMAWWDHLWRADEEVFDVHVSYFTTGHIMVARRIDFEEPLRLRKGEIKNDPPWSSIEVLW